MGMSKYFFKDATKFKMAARGLLQKKMWMQKLWNLKSEIIQISLSPSPPYGDVQVNFSSCYWNLKRTPRINFNLFFLAQKL